MSRFLIRPQAGRLQVTIYQGSFTFSSTLEEFKAIEPSLEVPSDLIILNYTPSFQHAQITSKGTQNLPLIWPEGDVFISKIQSYIKALVQHLALHYPTPTSLEEAKVRLTKAIYEHASDLISESNSKYSASEQAMWSTLVVEATAYVVDENISNCPNLYAQVRTRYELAGPDTPEFLAFLKEKAESLLAKNESVLTFINGVIGVRGSYTDQVSSFALDPEETEKSAIDLLLSLNWKANWPNL